MKAFFEMDKYVETDLAGFAEAEEEGETFRPDGKEVSDGQAE